MKRIMMNTALLLSLSASSFASAPSALNVTVCFSNIKAIKQITDAQCQAGLQKCYTINTKDKRFTLSDTMRFELKKAKANTSKKGDIRMITGNGLWKGDKSAVTHQPFSDPTYFKGVGFASDGIIKGVFADTFCKGEFEAKITK